MRKTNLMFVFGFLMILASAMMVSAALTNNAPSSISLGTETFTFEVNATDGSTGLEASINNGNISVGAIVSGVATVTVTGLDDSFDTITGKINATDGNVTSFSVDVEYGFCSDGEQSTSDAKLNIVDYSIDNFGRGDDEEWEYLDNLEIEVEVENPRSEDVSDVMVEIIVFDESGNDVTSEFDFDDEEIDLGRIKDDDEEVATFVIDKVKVEDLDAGDYRIYFKAYSEDEGESVVCTEDIDGEDYIEFSINSDLEDDFLVDESEEVHASCGDNGVSVSFDVWNLGTDKEEKILVNLYSSSLGVDEYAVIDDLRGGKEEGVNFVFDMPDYVSKDYYNLDVILFYEYDDDDGDEFDEDAYGEEVEDDFQVILRIDACSAPEPTIDVSTDDEIKVGSEFSFEVSVTNNADDAQNVIISLSDTSWAEDITIEPSVVALDAGETDTVTITMTATESGDHTFSVKSTIGTDTYTQPVSVNVDSKWSLGKYFSTDYWEYWLAIGLIVLILIVLIVIIAVVRR
ncbi:hypothetical protein CMI41_04630 [Candidatus Pacearchaeota archaeon]|nr:hypothetical protein [Candidatus Pacearchaeota archaeon]|tara:strand:+ start:19337 stop:20881 length:1545 start_codon:yes stop_codon:yes gene_type:complete